MNRVTVYRACLIAIAAGSIYLFFRNTLPELQVTQFDDAYMFTRYAKHWNSGEGFSWNAADGPSYGITSITHLIAVTATHYLTNISDARVLTSISFIAALLAVSLIVAMGFIFFPNLRKTWAPLFVVPYLMLGHQLHYHSQTGMETTLSLLINTLLAISVLYLANHRSTWSLAACLLAAYVAYLTRPDMGLFCLFLPPLFLLAADLRNWKLGLIYSSIFLLILFVDLFLKRAIFGDWLPLPYYSKSAGFYLGYLGGHQWNASTNTLMFLRESFPFIALIIFFASRKSIPRIAAVLLPMFLSIGYFACIMQVMGWNARYYFPMFPFMIMAAFISADSWLKERSCVETRGSFSIPRVCITLMFLVFLTSPMIESYAIRAWDRWKVGTPTDYMLTKNFTTNSSSPVPRTGYWKNNENVDHLLEKMPQDITIAASEHGYIAAQHLDMTIIDMVGLHDPTIAHQGFSAEYLLARKPDLIWFPHWHYTHMTREILDNKTFQEKYDFYPGIYNYGIAIRNDSPVASQVNEAFADDFQSMYPQKNLSDFKASYSVSE